MRRWLLAILVCHSGLALAQAPSGNLPPVTLERGESYFRFGGRPSFLLGTNPTGFRLDQFETLLEGAGQSGERVVRIHLTNGRVPRAGPGKVDEDWAMFWDQVFDVAAENGLYVLPVFAVWAEWNEEDSAQGWGANPYNARLGGPGANPADLLRDTPTQQLWLEWLGKLVTRWQQRPNILGWEPFSELNLITGASEAEAVDFVESAASVIRATDPLSRPITASLSGIRDWPSLSRSAAMDFIQIHPYANIQPYNGNLDEEILTVVRRRLRQYGKPVFIGESGLDSRAPVDTLTVAPSAPAGINHAIWAAAVSGAMNGRMLWFEDGYDQYHPGVDLQDRYKEASVPVVRFVRDVDYSGFQPIDLASGDDLKGAALGNEQLVVGWVRDTRSAAPEWPTRLLEGLRATLTVPGQATPWQVEFHDTGTGELVSSDLAHRQGADIAVLLPPFEASIAFKMRLVRASQPTFTAAAVVNAASFVGGPVAPGEIVTIFGSTIGPPVLAGLRLNPAGLVDIELAETTVLFDGVYPAPLIYVSGNQSSAIVPYAVAGKNTTLAQVDYMGDRSVPVPIQVTTAAPALFTLDSSGRGSGAILNQDFTVNTNANAARKGSIVVLFGTGEGQTDPSGIDGMLAGTVLPKSRLPVQVRIGGIEAKILYAGAAPGLVAGVIQINVRIPEGAASGNAVPVTFSIGAVDSQPGVTLTIQ